MDFNGVKNHVQKALEYVQSRVDSGSKVYGKSRQCLEDIIELCRQLIGAVSGLVQVEVQEAEPQKPSQDADLQTQIDFLSEGLKCLSVEVKYLKNFVCQPEVTEPKPKQQPVSKTEKVTTAKFTPDESKQIVGTYASTLKRLANTDCNVPVANECASILWRWHEARILKNNEYAKRFIFNPSRIKELIYSLVIAFGYHVENGTTENFFGDFDEWVNGLRTNPNSNSWPAPREVTTMVKNYKENKTIDRAYANLTAVVIWDVLLDNGLDSLCRTEPRDVYLRENEIHERVERADIDVLDPYVNYTVDPTILDRLKLRT